MIRVQRPAAVPVVLRNQGALATQALCDAYDSSPAAYASGTLAFEDFADRIYAHEEVKNALRQAQHDKCCFCESKVGHIAYGDVEHFRPKKAFRQRPGDPLVKPGYYWLAYEWTNLYFCCQLCNQRFKQNLFPLVHPRRRARSHRDNLADEEPLFINPQEDPSRHLRFREEMAYAYRNSRRGQATIDSLGLNRSELLEKRRNHLTDIIILTESRNLLTRAIRNAQRRNDKPPARFAEQTAKIDARLAELALDSAEYAAMVRAALAKS